MKGALFGLSIFNILLPYALFHYFSLYNSEIVPTILRRKQITKQKQGLHREVVNGEPDNHEVHLQHQTYM